MGSDFYEDNYGKVCKCKHKWERSFKTKRDNIHHRNIYFRKCSLCKQKQVGLSWIGYQQHGITWYDREDDAIQYLLIKLKVKK